MTLVRRNLLKYLCLSLPLGLLATGCASNNAVSPESLPETVQIDPALFNLSGLLSPVEVLENQFREMHDAGISPVASDAVDIFQSGQEARWRTVLADTAFELFRIRQFLSIRIPLIAIFSENGSDIDPSAYASLELMADVFSEFEQTVIEIAAHTDDPGSPSYNLDLSARRARSLARFLETRNVRSARIIEMPVGASYPVANEETAVGRGLNRRIEITLVPYTSSEIDSLTTGTQGVLP